MSAPSPGQGPPQHVRERGELARQLERLRSAGRIRRVVLANGCFDLLHPGHVDYLEAARKQGDCLVVALNDDAGVRALKGPARPIQPLADRARVVSALRAVDFVTAFAEADLEATLRLLRPSVHAKGSDYTPESVPERSVDLELGIEIAICGAPKTRSTSALAARCAGPRAAPEP